MAISRRSFFGFLGVAAVAPAVLPEVLAAPAYTRVPGFVPFVPPVSGLRSVGTIRWIRPVPFLEGLKIEPDDLMLSEDEERP